MANDNSVNVKFTVLFGDFTAGLNQATRGLQDSTQQMKSHMESMNSKFASIGTSISSSLASMFSLAAIGGFVRGARQAVTEAEGAFRGLEAVANYTGVGIGKAMQEAQKLSADGLVSVAESSKALQNLLARGYSIEQAVETLNRLKDAATYNRVAHLSMGEAVVTASEGLKNENSILVDNAGVTKNVSKMWEDYARTIGKGAASLSQAEKIQAEYNGIMQETEAQVGNAAKAAETMAGKQSQLDSATKNLMVSVGEALTPAFMYLIDVGKGVISFFDQFVRVFQIVGAQIAKTATDIGTLWDAISTLNFKGLDSKLERNAQVLRDTVDDIMNKKAGGSFTANPDSGKRKQDAPPPKDKPKKSGEILNTWKQELQEKRDAEDAFHSLSKAAEAEFWAGKLQHTKKGSAEYKVAQHEMLAANKAQALADSADYVARLELEKTQYKNSLEAQLEIAQRVAEEKKKFGENSKEYIAAQNEIINIERQVADQRREIAVRTAQEKSAIRLAEVEERQADAALQAELGNTTKQEMIEQERQFEAEKFAIKLQALEEQKAIALENPDTNVEKLAELHAQIEELTLQHNQRLNEIKREAITEQQKDALSFRDSLSGGFQSVIAQFLQGSLTIKNLFQGMFKAIISSLANFLAQKAAMWLANQLMELAGFKTKAAIEGKAAVGLAGANAVASWALAPWPINIGAPAFGAAMAASAAGFAATASAAGGYDIPPGVNPVTQLHAREMVLPAEHADTIRGMAEGGGGGTTVNYHDYSGRLTAADIERNASVITRVLKGQARNFAM